ncbi:hypothetical protein SAMN06295912_15019 [Sphingomonas laterariae]|uniref:Uncharacterized protein n=1 Tax=Edaphosphingomonas laterariae TaxID=861865 RepID=A0A239KE37_9SPHN|nr:hypothetical protein [Sphingomonas laterariae]SNT15972.1 hypothetical protein SAMN06295912_15019 [Sphingomonas laterariae]
MAGLFGGTLGVFVLFVLWEFALFKRVMDDPLKGKMLSVLAAWLTIGGVAGFGLANGGPYYWPAFGVYAIPAVIVGTFAYWRGSKLREEIEQAPVSEDVIDTFR